MLYLFYQSSVFIYFSPCTEMEGAVTDRHGYVLEGVAPLM